MCSDQCIKQHSEYIAKTEVTLNCWLFCHEHHKALINITFNRLRYMKSQADPILVSEKGQSTLVIYSQVYQICKIYKMQYKRYFYMYILSKQII